MRILIDLDDVMNKLSEHWCDVLNERYGTEVKREDIKDWGIEEFFPNLTSEQVVEPLTEVGFWDDVEPMENAVDAVKFLIDRGHDVYVVTNSYYHVLNEKMENMLFKHFPFIDWDHVIIAKNKQMIIGDVLIDDGIHNLLDGPQIKILFDAPWNRGVEAAKMGVYRARDWDTIVDIIEEISGDQVWSTRGVGVKSRIKQEKGE